MTLKSFRLPLLAIVITAVIGGAVIAMEPELNKIHQAIADDYDAVDHLDGDAFETLDPETVIVFDVREADEYAVSHIANAIQVDPSIKPADFLAQYGDQLKDKTVVFYCSVGRRSSHLANEVETEIRNAGATASYNLIGGLFQWHNEDRSLAGFDGSQTSAIHPYNTHWGRLIERKSEISYTPIPTSDDEDHD